MASNDLHLLDLQRMTETDSERSRRSARTILPLAGVVLVGLLTVALYSSYALQPSFKGTPYDPPAPAPEFVLTDHRGEEARLSDFHGRPVLLFFGFVHCPDFCPLTLAKLSRVLDSIGADSSRVNVLLVTVDPERDTPEALASYISRFSAPITAFAGHREELAGVWKSYGVYAVQQHGEHTTSIAHTPRVFGIDRNGQLRVLIAPEEADATVEADVRALLRAR